MSRNADSNRTMPVRAAGTLLLGLIVAMTPGCSLLRAPKAMQIVEGATHLFPEVGAMEAVIEAAADWFARHLVA